MPAVVLGRVNGTSPVKVEAILKKATMSMLAWSGIYDTKVQTRV